MVSWCAVFYEGEFLKMSSLSARMLTLVGAPDRINWLRDQLFEQSFVNIYVFVWIACGKVVIVAGRYCNSSKWPMIIAGRCEIMLKRNQKYYAFYTRPKKWSKYFFWYMISWCASFYQGDFLKVSSLSARMQKLRMRARIQLIGYEINLLNKVW